MTRDRTVPILPCRDVDEVAAFYAMLGFEATFRQLRPYPCVVLHRGDIDFHFAGIEGFDPAQSYGSCLLVTVDADGLYRAFAAGLRAGLGRLPTTGIPRVTRPRKRNGVVYGFSVVDPGGNWIRVVQVPGLADPDAADEPGRSTGLAKALETAVTLGDSKGDAATAAEVLDRALVRFPAGRAVERVAALVYRAELAMTLGDRAGALGSLAAMRLIVIDDDDREVVAADLERGRDLAR